MAKSSAGDFTVGKIQKTRRQRVAKMYGQQKRNIIHTSSTAYEQDHSAAAHNPRVAHGLSPRFSVRFNGRSLLEPFVKRSVRQKRSPGEIEIIDGAAFEDISWVAAITWNIDSN
jgi:hypothetical protein